MTFKLIENLPIVELKEQYTHNARYYVTPVGTFPSVTSVLGNAGDNSWLQEWRDRVGEAEANKISAQAKRRGTAFHSIAERYIRGENYELGEMPVNLISFKRIKPILDKNLGLVAGLELPLYSKKLRVAGRSDCIGKWNGVWSVVDFKTSRRVKTKDEIESYFIQESVYAHMFQEMFGIEIPNIVTVMSVDNAEPLVFEEKTSNWIDQFISIRESVDL